MNLGRHCSTYAPKWCSRSVVSACFVSEGFGEVGSVNGEVDAVVDGADHCERAGSSWVKPACLTFRGLRGVHAPGRLRGNLACRQLLDELAGSKGQAEGHGRQEWW